MNLATLFATSNPDTSNLGGLLVVIVLVLLAIALLIWIVKH